MILLASPHKQKRRYYLLPGFRFENIDEYREGMKRLERCSVEKVTINFLAGTTAEVELFKVMKVCQTNIEDWFAINDQLFSYHDYAVACYLLEYGMKR